MWLHIITLNLLPGSSAVVVDTAPLDDDADVSVTTRTDRDGATIRPPRVTFLSAADSYANSALVGPSRGPLDAFEVEFDRMGVDGEGTIHRLLAYSNRAADALAIRAIIVEYDVVDEQVDVLALDQATGTDRDGGYMRVAQLTLRTAMESLRNADLTIASATERDATQAYFHTAMEQDQGFAGRLLVDQAGRGGDVYAIRAVEIEYDVIDGDQVRAEEY